MPFNKIKSLALTLRPRGGITDDDIALFLNMVMDRTDYRHIILEKKDSERHIHAALYLRTETTLSAFNQMMKRKFEKIFEERQSIWKYAYKGKQMYNDDWVVQYLINANEGEGAKSEDECVVLESYLPDEEVRSTYYSDVPNAKKTRPSGDAYFLKLEKLYYEMIPEGTLAPSRDPTLQEIEHFLCVMMFKERKLRIITDSRKMRRVCKCLQKFICKATAYCWAKGDVESDIQAWPESR